MAILVAIETKCDQSEEEVTHSISNSKSTLWNSMCNVIRDVTRTGSLYSQWVRDILNWVRGIKEILKAVCIVKNQIHINRKEQVII